MGFAPPNYTQVPNQIFEEWLPKLKLVELRVLMVIVRKTFGWHKIRDRISLSQLMKLTGSQKRDITKATDELEKMNLITKFVTGENGENQTFYELVVYDSNNSYRCESHTPTGVNLTPTKETTTKERKKEKREKEKEEVKPPQPPTPQKMSFGENGHVKLSKEDLESLVEKHGKEKVDVAIEEFDEWAEENPVKRLKERKNHKASIARWIRTSKLFSKPEISKNAQENRKTAVALKIALGVQSDKVFIAKDYVELRVFKNNSPTFSWEEDPQEFKKQALKLFNKKEENNNIVDIGYANSKDVRIKVEEYKREKHPDMDKNYAYLQNIKDKFPEELKLNYFPDGVLNRESNEMVVYENGHEQFIKECKRILNIQ